MSEIITQMPDDSVGRAVAAARQLPIPEGPAPAIVSLSLGALHNAARRPKATLVRRIYHLPWKSKAAAVLGLAASALVAYVVLSSSSGNSLAWAQAIDKILAAKTLTSDLSLQSAGGHGLVAKGRMLFDEGNNVRCDLHVVFLNQESDLTLILNMNAGKSILLDRGGKEAVVDLMKVGDENFLKQTAFERLKALAKESTTPLGKKQFDGVECEGFEIRRGITVRLWVNAKTGDPFRLEEDDLPVPQPIGNVNALVSNFNIDGKLDASLFKVEPPEGYAVLKSPFTIDLTGKPGNDLVVLLRFYAKQSGGLLPERLLDPADPIFKKMNVLAGANEKPTPENMELGLVQGNMMRLRMYLAGHKQGTDYEYYPGVKLGEKERIVFWSRSTKTGEYTAVYGDLRVEKIDKEKLPAPEKDSSK